jgi:serine protease AprX
MAISFPTSLVEFILLGPQDDRRQLQDSPILGDVWVAFGRRPGERIDLLITPYRGMHSGSIAGQIEDELGGDDPNVEDQANIAFLQGCIAARLTFRELTSVVMPKTNWWISKREKENDALQELRDHENAKEIIKQILNSIKDWHSNVGKLRLQELPAVKRILALTSILTWGEDATLKANSSSDDQIASILDGATEDLNQVAEIVSRMAKRMLNDSRVDPLIWQVSRNRTAMPAISKSVPAVKADAATTLFKVNCSELTWAVIDSGIDGRHPAFFDKNGVSRVKRSFDFQNFRKIVSLGNSRDAIREKNVLELTDKKQNLLSTPDPDQANEDLKRLAEDARNRGPVHWEIVEKFIEIKPDTPPHTNHGTHVAGIIGASKAAAQMALVRSGTQISATEDAKIGNGENLQEIVDKAIEGALEKVNGRDTPAFSDGMCPDISLYDFRVLGPAIEDAEFAIIAALQFIQYLNSRDNFLVIHGANLSLSIPHDVRNFACGRTPICDECEKLISSGVVVVAAAGNHGYKSYETKDGSYDSYAAFSITDPGNADNVITVGATHRFWPHTYGVSFFSSRGPTGDGRMKPDLVAPGERIRAPIPGNHELGGEWGDLDGTSMAAPHVSGAAAMLMARYSELVGQPNRIKRILCESATDLGRERSFQGNGMLDVLRAFQSI